MSTKRYTQEELKGSNANKNLVWSSKHIGHRFHWSLHGKYRGKRRDHKINWNIPAPVVFRSAICICK